MIDMRLQDKESELLQDLFILENDMETAFIRSDFISCVIELKWSSEANVLVGYRKVLKRALLEATGKFVDGRKAQLN